MEKLLAYLCRKAGYTAGVNAFMEFMPDAPEHAFCIITTDLKTFIPPQLQLDKQRYIIRTRHTSFARALAAAQRLCGHLLTDSAEYPSKPIAELDTTGIIQLDETNSILCLLRQPPRKASDDFNQRQLRAVDFIVDITKQITF